jgi:predicted S18 family serine protease
VIPVDRKNVIIGLLCILLVLSVSSFFLLYQKQQRIITEQEETIEKLTNAQNAGRGERGTWTDFSESTGCVNIVAVRSDDYMGVLGQACVEVVEGNGNVLVDTNPFVEPTTQYSLREAVKVAENFTKVDVSNVDIIIFFDIKGNLIGGPSAGAATTAAIIAALEGKEIRDDVVITGTIEEDGHIGQVGGIFEKALAADKSGMKLFLVPKGQKKLIYYEQKEGKREIFGFTFTRVYYVPKEIDLSEYMAGKMEVEEVATIEEVVANMIK